MTQSSFKALPHITLRPHRIGHIVTDASQGNRLGQNALPDARAESFIRDQVDRPPHEVADLAFEGSELEQAQRPSHREEEIDVRIRTGHAGRHGSEDANVTPTGFPNESADVPPVLAQSHGSGGRSVEAEES